MKKIVIILILLSMISVIGCSPQLDEEVVVKVMQEQEQEIEYLQKQIKELEAENKILREGGEYLIEKLKEINDCVYDMYEAMGDADSGYITIKDAQGRILLNIARISNILMELKKSGIIMK